MTDEQEKDPPEEAEQEQDRNEPDSGGLSLVEDDQPASRPVEDFDFDLDDDLVDFPDPLPDSETTEELPDFPLEEGGPGQVTGYDETGIEALIPADAEIEYIEETALDAPFADEPVVPTEKFKLNKTEEDDVEERADETETGDSPRASILHALAIPENAIKHAYRNSNLREKLLENLDWYRVRVENQQMEEILEKTYGGAAEKGFNPAHFIRSNLLVSLLVVLLAALAIRLVVMVNSPEPQSDDESIVASAVTAEQKMSRPPAAGHKVVTINYVNKSEITALLQHCLVLPDTRREIDQRFTKTGYEFSEPNLTRAYEQLHDFTTVYDRLEIPTRVQDAINRFGILAHAMMPALRDAREKVSTYRKQLSEIHNQVDGLEKQLAALSIGRQDTNTINRQIKLRSERDHLNDILTKSPDNQQFDVLDKAIDRLEKGFAKPDAIQRMSLEEKEAELPRWFASLPDDTMDNLKTALQDSVQPEIALHANALSPTLAELSTFHIRELTDVLEQLYLVASSIMYTPERLLDTYNKDIHGVDKRLGALLGTEHSEWLSFDPCVQQARAKSSP